MSRMIFLSCALAMFLFGFSVAENLPNVEFFQLGVKLPRMNADQSSADPGFGSNVFKLKYSNCLNSGFLLPDAICSNFVRLSAATIANAATYVYSSADYQMSMSYESDFSKSLSIGSENVDLLDLSLRVSTDFKAAAEFFASGQGAIITSRAKCSVWSASLSAFIAPDALNLIELDREFVYRISKLPVNFGDGKEYFAMIDDVGTHYIKTLLMGAKVAGISFFSDTTIATMKSEGLDLDACASESTWFHASSKSADVQESASAQKYDQHASGKQKFNFHGPPPPSNDPSLWPSVVEKNPYPLQMSLSPLTDLMNPVWFPDDPNISVKAINFAKAMRLYCPATGNCYNPSPPPPPPVWEAEIVANAGETKQLMLAKKGVCVLTEVYRTSFDYCTMYIAADTVGSADMYWYVQASAGSNTVCAARCSSKVTWASIVNATTNSEVSASFRSYRIDKPVIKGTFPMALPKESAQSSFCMVSAIQNEVGCFDYCRVYTTSNVPYLELATDNPWDQKHQYLNSMNRACNGLCLSVVAPPKLLLTKTVDSTQGVQTLTKAKESICMCSRIQGACSTGERGKGGGVHLKIQKVPGAEEEYWTVEGYTATGTDKCQGTCEASCYAL